MKLVLCVFFIFLLSSCIIAKNECRYKHAFWVISEKDTIGEALITIRNKDTSIYFIKFAGWPNDIYDEPNSY